VKSWASFAGRDDEIGVVSLDEGSGVKNISAVSAKIV
jgi:hypothetical protein